MKYHFHFLCEITWITFRRNSGAGRIRWLFINCFLFRLTEIIPLQCDSLFSHAHGTQAPFSNSKMLFDPNPNISIKTSFASLLILSRFCHNTIFYIIVWKILKMSKNKISFYVLNTKMYFIENTVRNYIPWVKANVAGWLLGAVKAESKRARSSVAIVPYGILTVGRVSR